MHIENAFRTCDLVFFIDRRHAHVASHKQYLLSQHTRCLIVLSGTTEHKPFANCTFHLKHAMHDALLYLPLHCALFLSKFLITCTKLHLPFAAQAMHSI
mmetsp:Transcript_23871/g.61949  ORF Transcript_23871/g.61949 Transcript_23871/m.61949 type:complete len:99 (+) Transcript_23871:307-603(+)